MAAGSSDIEQTIVEEPEVAAHLRRPIPNAFVYRAIVIVLGISVLAVIVAQMWLVLEKTLADIPDGPITIGSVAI